MRLVDRHPGLGASELAKRFQPPLRFSDVRFSSYQPDPAYPSQRQALDRLRRFAIAGQPRRKKWFTKASPVTPRGMYLDGGFGVGKTHLLASLWHETPGRHVYLTFTELTAYVGFAGMMNAVRSFDGTALICIDEFELDDVASTLMVVSFLRGVIERGPVRLAVTSNTIPGKLGEQRFSAADFKREIAAIAAHFEELRVDGGDYRTTHAVEPLDARPAPEGTTNDDFDELLTHLRTVHPVQFGAMLDGVGAVLIRGVRTITSEPDALRWVAFVDKLYDAHIPVELKMGTDQLFDMSYRDGAYRKKYGRAESRTAAMNAESAGLF